MHHSFLRVFASSPSSSIVGCSYDLYRRPPAPVSGHCGVTTPYYGYIERDGIQVSTNHYKLKYTAWGDVGPLVVLLGGEGKSIGALLPLQRHLASHCRTLSLDLLGCGASDLPLDYGHYIDEVLLEEQNATIYGGFNPSCHPWQPSHDVYYLEQALRDLVGEEGIILVADGLSSEVVLRLASTRKCRVAGMVLYGPNLYPTSLPYVGSGVDRWAVLSRCSRKREISCGLKPYDSHLYQEGLRYSEITCPSLVSGGTCDIYRLLYALHNSRCQVERVIGGVSLLVERPAVVAESLLCWLIGTFGHSSLGDAFQGYEIEYRGDERDVQSNLRCLFFAETPRDTTTREETGEGVPILGQVPEDYYQVTSHTTSGDQEWQVAGFAMDYTPWCSTGLEASECATLRTIDGECEGVCPCDDLSSWTPTSGGPAEDELHRGSEATIPVVTVMANPTI